MTAGTGVFFRYALWNGKGVNMVYAQETVMRLKDSVSIVIYGAGRIAQTVYYCMIQKPYDLKIDCFLVSDLNGNPDEIDGIPVVAAGKWMKRDAVVLIAVMDGFLQEIQKVLDSYGYTNVLSVTFESDLWGQLRGNYFYYLYKDMGMDFLRLEDETDQVSGTFSRSEQANIYVVTSGMDRKTRMEYGARPWETIICAGAALSESVGGSYDVRDDTGDNISVKNHVYCELTALYWIWKHDLSEYQGISHYRRRFELDAARSAGLCRSDIDVVLTIPVLNYPCVYDMYVLNHCVQDWHIMMEAIRRLYPQYYKMAQMLQNGNFYYGFNMLIAKRKVLSSYCEWLFSILEYCEQRCEKKPRYIGYLAERLMGIYFLKNWDLYKIVHGRRHFMSKELP